jgi:hypothetical protein
MNKKEARRPLLLYDCRYQVETGRDVIVSDVDGRNCGSLVGSGSPKSKTSPVDGDDASHDRIWYQTKEKIVPLTNTPQSPRKRRSRQALGSMIASALSRVTVRESGGWGPQAEVGAVQDSADKA